MLIPGFYQYLWVQKSFVQNSASTAVLIAVVCWNGLISS